MFCGVVWCGVVWCGADMSEGHHDRVTAFAGAWSTLLFIIISVVGTYFMSHVSTSVV
jgi:hypothetical protein